jgi:hypothetical protein
MFNLFSPPRKSKEFYAFIAYQSRYLLLFFSKESLKFLFDAYRNDNKTLILATDATQEEAIVFIVMIMQSFEGKPILIPRMNEILEGQAGSVSTILKKTRLPIQTRTVIAQMYISGQDTSQVSALYDLNTFD